MGVLNDARQWLVNDIQQAINQYHQMFESDARDRQRVANFFETVLRPAKESALRAALAECGLDMPEGPINEYTVTQAINTQYLGDLDMEINNIFNKYEVREALEKVAIRTAAQQLGFQMEHYTIDGIKQALIAEMAGVIGDQLAAEAGDIFEAGIPSPKVAAMISSALKSRPSKHTNEAVDMTPKGAANRAAQAKFRANNPRVWRLKPGALASVKRGGLPKIPGAKTKGG